MLYDIIMLATIITIISIIIFINVKYKKQNQNQNQNIEQHIESFINSNQSQSNHIQSETSNPIQSETSNPVPTLVKDVSDANALINLCSSPYMTNALNLKTFREIINKDKPYINTTEDYDTLQYALKTLQFAPASFEDGTTKAGNIEEYEKYTDFDNIGKLLLGPDNFKYAKASNYLFSGIQIEKRK